MPDATLSRWSDRAHEAVGRGVLVILITGVVLGLAFNQLGRASNPRRGLPWIAEPKKLLSLEEILSQTGSGRPAADPLEPQAPVAATPQTPRAGTAKSPEPSASTKKPSAAPSRTKTTSPAPAESPARISDDPMALDTPSGDEGGVPEIPDLGRPLQVELKTAKKLFDAGAALFVDAREPDEYAEGHIAGAISLPYDQGVGDPARLESLDAGGRPIIIYCGGGNCEVSMTLAEALIYQAGKRKVLVYMGGYPEWVGAGYPVDKGSQAGGKS